MNCRVILRYAICLSAACLAGVVPAAPPQAAPLEAAPPQPATSQATAPQAVPPQATPPQAAPPQESRAQFMHNAIADYFVPRMAGFARSAPNLARSVESLCSSPGSETLKASRSAWIETMLAWESASVIGFGPLLARRSVYRIDYWPARSNMILRALGQPPTTIKGLELIGGPAKGIPAIEWLLWTPAENPEILSDPARCAYAQLLSLEVVEEARALNEAFVAFAATGLPEGMANDAFAGLLNLTNGGLEQLGDKKILIPGKIGDGKNFPRLASGQTVAAWNAQWASLRSFLVGDDGAPHDNLEAFLRAQHLAAAADKLQAAADRVTKQLQATPKPAPAAAIALGKDIGALRNTLADDVATALNIAIQFGDNDGD